MSESNFKRGLEKDISIHIFSVSAALVGVCLTVISVVRVVITTAKINTVADDILAADALLFLTSCLLAYSAMRSRTEKRMRPGQSSAADAVFIVGLLLMAAVCGLITYAMIPFSAAAQLSPNFRMRFRFRFRYPLNSS